MARATIEDVTSVIGAIYEAAYDQSLWRVAMESIAALFDGSRACIVRTEDAVVSAIGSYSDEEFERHNWSTDDGACLLRDGMLQMKVGQIYTRGQVVDEQAFRQSDIWDRFFRKREMADSINCNLIASSRATWVIDVSRAERAGRFGPDDVELMRKIAPHIQRAGEIGKVLQGASTLSKLYDGLPFGLLVIDGDMTIHHANQIAQATLSAKEIPFLERQGKLVAASQRIGAELTRIVRNAFGVTEAGDGVGGTVIVPFGPDFGDRRLLVSVAPLAETVSYGLRERHCAVVMLREMTAENTEPIDQNLPRLFKLSPMEAQVAASLARGQTLKEIAEERGIKAKTARGYLENVFRKTGTHRQGELVTMLRSMQPVLRL